MRRGLTLIELIVVLAVFAIAGALVAQTFRNVRTQTQLVDRTITAEQEARSAMERVVGLLSVASVRGLETLSGYAGPELRLRVPERDSAGRIILVADEGRAWSPALPDTLTTVAAADGYLVEETAGPDGVVLESRILSAALAPNEDRDGDGVLDPGEDVTRDGRLQRGCWFIVNDEDADGDGEFGPGEDQNRNGRLDCVVTVRIDTYVADPLGRDHGRATLETRVRLRNE